MKLDNYTQVQWRPFTQSVTRLQRVLTLALILTASSKISSLKGHLFGTPGSFLPKA